MSAAERSGRGVGVLCGGVGPCVGSGVYNAFPGAKRAGCGSRDFRVGARIVCERCSLSSSPSYGSPSSPSPSTTPTTPSPPLTAARRRRSPWPPSATLARPRAMTPTLTTPHRQTAPRGQPPRASVLDSTAHPPPTRPTRQRPRPPAPPPPAATTTTTTRPRSCPAPPTHPPRPRINRAIQPIRAQRPLARSPAPPRGSDAPRSSRITAIRRHLRAPAPAPSTRTGLRVCSPMRATVERAPPTPTQTRAGARTRARARV